MVRTLSFTFGLLLCMGLLCEAQGPKVKPSSIGVRSLDVVKLVDEKRQPMEVEAKVRLQTFGTALHSLRVFYRSSADAAFKDALCELLPDLKYYARLPYSPLIDYYFVATPLAGAPIKFGEGTIVGSDLELRPWAQTDPWRTYVAAGVAGIAATITSVLLNSDHPAGLDGEKTRHGPGLYVGIGAVAGGVTASILYLTARHKKRKLRLSDHPSEHAAAVP